MGALPALIMHPTLGFEESRVLGCLLEKEMATPEYYPLTPAALLAACNQLSNRDPVVAFDQATADAATVSLRRKGMVAMIHMAGSRVGKLRHLLDEVFPSLGRPERALLAVLMLRGPQTTAELRTRTERMHAFASAEEVEQAAGKLLDCDGTPLIVHLPPGGGRRVATYAHLLCGQGSATAAPVPASVVAPPPDALDDLTEQVSALRTEVAQLTRRLAWLEESLGTQAPESDQ